MAPYERAMDLSWRSRNYYLGEGAVLNVSLHLGNATRERTRLRATVVDGSNRELLSGKVDRLSGSSFRLGLDFARLTRPGFYRLRVALANGRELAADELPFRMVARPVFRAPTHKEQNR